MWYECTYHKSVMILVCSMPWERKEWMIDSSESRCIGCLWETSGRRQDVGVTGWGGSVTVHPKPCSSKAWVLSNTSLANFSPRSPTATHIKSLQKSAFQKRKLFQNSWADSVLFAAPPPHKCSSLSHFSILLNPLLPPPPPPPTHIPTPSSGWFVPGCIVVWRALWKRKPLPLMTFASILNQCLGVPIKVFVLL